MAVKKIKIVIRNLEESFTEDKKVANEIDSGIFRQRTPTLSLGDYQTYKKILTPKRLELLRIISVEKPKNIKELATLAKRDFKNVYDDSKILESVGLIKLKYSQTGLIPKGLYNEIDIQIKIPLEAISK